MPYKPVSHPVRSPVSRCYGVKPGIFAVFFGFAWHFSWTSRSVRSPCRRSGVFVRLVAEIESARRRSSSAPSRFAPKCFPGRRACLPRNSGLFASAGSFRPPSVAKSNPEVLLIGVPILGHRNLVRVETADQIDSILP